MKLLCKTITSHTCLEIFQSTNDTKPKRWRLVPEFFGRLKMRKKRKLIENGTPKSTSTVKKWSVKKHFLEWPNGR